MSHTTRSQLEGSAVNYGVDTDLVQPSLPKLQRSQFMQPPASVYEESMTQNTITTNGHMKASGWPLGYGERRSGGAQDNTVNSDATHLQQHTLQQSRLTVDADPTTAPTFATPSTMLDVVLGVEVKQQDREEGVRQLGVSVRTSRGGMNGVSRLLTIRLTDPSDPFFLFELELLEEDYGVFKQRLELLVDFSGFPQYFVNMVHKVAMGLGALQLCFVVNSSDAGRGTLRIIEITEYKTVEHISVLLIRQGDAGQKKYLAERYQHFEKLYVCTAAERKEEAAAASRAIDDLSRRNEELTELQRKNGEALKLVSTQSEMMQLSAANTLKESHMQELKSMRAELELKLSETQKRLEYLQTQTQSDGLDKEKQLNQLRDKLRESESALTTLRSQHRLMEDTNTTYLEELTKLRSTNAELTSHKLETTRLMSENEVNYVSLKERLAGANSALKERKEEIVSLRTQNEQQDGYISMLTTQNEKLSEQQKLTERKLEKANYIIANQLQNIKSGKERHTIALDQLRSQAALLQERQNAHDRVKEELSSANERIRSLLGKNTELKEQLKKTDDAREKLASELKQNQNALVQLQRSTTINGRHWTIPSGAPTPMNSYAMGQTSFGSTHLGSVPLPTGTTPSPHVSGARDWNRAGSQASRAPSASRASDGNGIATALFTTPLAPNYSGSTPRQAAESASSLEKTEPKRVADTIVAHMNQPEAIAKTAGSLMAKTFLENGDAAAVVSAYF